MELQDRIVEIIQKELGLESPEALASASYSSIPEWDSVGHMHIVAALEEEFGITFADGEIAQITNVAKIVSAIQGKTAANG